jgi:hypothetical protein
MTNKAYVFNSNNYIDTHVFDSDYKRAKWLDENYPGWSNKMGTIIDESRIVIGWLSTEE